MNKPSAKSKASPGTCLYCGKKITARSAKGHLATCLAKREGGDLPSRLFLIKVEGSGYGPDKYWMYVLMPEEAKLKDLDTYLRRTWLECCGHLSQFYINRHIRIAMGKALGDVLQPSMEFLYDYDFGSTTTLKVSVAGVVNGVLKKGKVELAARNDAPEPACEVCGEKAALICPQCAEDDSGWLCEHCADEHDCGLGSFLPVVNSPRAGVCGYVG